MFIRGLPNKMTILPFAFAFFNDFLFCYSFYVTCFMQHDFVSSKLALLLIMMNVAKMVADIPVGVLSDVVSRKMVLLIGLLFRCGFCFMCLIGSGFWMFFLAVIFAGIGNSCLWTQTMNYFYDYLKNQKQEHRFARFMGTYYAISNSAIALASFAGSIVFSAFNFFGVFLGTIITLFIASLIVLRLPNYKPKTNINTAKHLKVASPLQFVKLIRELLKKPQIIRLLILTILMDTMFIVFLDMNTTMMNVAGIKAENISQIVGLVAVVRIFSNYFSGKTEKFMSFKRSHSFLLVLMIISVCASLYNSNILIATISTYLCLYPFFDTSIKTKIEHRLDVNTRATIISIVSLFTSVFVILFNALIGLIAEQSGYFSVPVCIFLLVIVVLFLIRNLMFLYRADAFFRKLVAKIKRIAQK